MLYSIGTHLAAYVKGDKCITWHPDTGSGVVGNINLFNSLLKQGNALDTAKKVAAFFGSLYQHGSELIQWHEEWEKHIYRSVNPTNDVGSNLRTLRLTLVTSCNLRCTYCYQEDDHWKNYRTKKHLAWEMAKTALDYYFKAIVPNNGFADIVFYGGEPLLNWVTLKKVVHYTKAYCAERSIPYSFHLITNGTLFTQEKIDYVIDNHIGVSISIDGVGDVHDASRKTRSGSGSFDKIHNALHLFRRRQYSSISLSCTLNDTNWRYLKNLVDYAVEMGVLDISLNDDYITPHSLLQAEERDRIIENFIEFFHYCREKHITPKGFYINRLLAFIKGLGTKVAAPKNQLKPLRCGGCGYEMNLLPSGEIKSCPGIQNAIGDVHSLEELTNSPYLKILQNRTVVKLHECRDCPIRGICLAGCTANAEQSKGDHYAKPTNCEFYYYGFQKFMESIL